MGKARARRASDDRLERLQALADQLAELPTDEELDGEMSGDDAVSALSVFIETARDLSDARPQAHTVERSRTFHDVYVAIRSRPQPDLRTFDDLMGSAAEASGFKAPALVDRQDTDGFVYITTETIKPCTPCSGTGEIIEYPPDDDERMVACPACGGTGEAITL